MLTAVCSEVFSSQNVVYSSITLKINLKHVDMIASTRVFFIIISQLISGRKVCFLFYTTSVCWNNESSNRFFKVLQFLKIDLIKVCSELEVFAAALIEDELI